MKLYVGQKLSQSFLSDTKSIFMFNPVSTSDWYTISSFEAAHASVDVNANIDKSYNVGVSGEGIGPAEFLALPEKPIARFTHVKDEHLIKGSPIDIRVVASSLSGVASVELSVDNSAPITMTAPGQGGNTTNEYVYSYTPTGTHASRVTIRAKVTPSGVAAVPRLIEQTFIIVDTTIDDGGYVTWYVDSNAGLDTNDGNLVAPYQTLAKAVQTARGNKGLEFLADTDKLYRISLNGNSGQTYNWKMNAFGAHTDAAQYTWLRIDSYQDGFPAKIRAYDSLEARCSLRCQKVWWKNVTFDFTTFDVDGVTTNKSVCGFKGENVKLTDDTVVPYDLWVDGCTLNGPTNMLANEVATPVALPVSSFVERSGTPDDWSQGWIIEAYATLDPAIDADFNSLGEYTGTGTEALANATVEIEYIPAVDSGTVIVRAASQADRDLLLNNPLKSRILCPADIVSSNNVPSDASYYPFRFGDLATANGTLELKRTAVDGRYSWLADLPTTVNANLDFNHRYYYDVELVKGALFSPSNGQVFITSCTADSFADGVLAAELCMDTALTRIEGDVISYNQFTYKVQAIDCGLYADGAHRDQYQSGDNNITAVEVLGKLDPEKCLKENIIVMDVDYGNSLGQGPFVAGRANRTYGLLVANSTWTLNDFNFPLSTQIDNDRYLQHNHLLMVHNTIQQQVTWKSESNFDYASGDVWYDSSGTQISVTTNSPRYSFCGFHGNLLYEFMGPAGAGATLGSGSDGCLLNVTNTFSHQNHYFFESSGSFSNFYALTSETYPDYATWVSNKATYPYLCELSDYTNATLPAAVSNMSTSPYFLFDINGSARGATYQAGSGDILSVSTLPAS